MQRVGSHARVVGVIVINQRKTSAQFLPILYFHVQLCFKKVKWTLIFFFPSLLLLFPTNTQPHTCTHTNTPSTHAHKHAHARTHRVLIFTHVGESRAEPGQSWAEPEDETPIFRFLCPALQKWLPQAYHKAPCSAQFLFSSAAVPPCSHLVG